MREPESLIVPGLINCHVHFNSSLIRGLIDDLGLEEWDEEIPPPPQYGNRRWRHLATRLVLLEMVKAGVTSYADGSGDDEDGLKERYESGLRGFLSLRIMDEVEDFRALLQLVRERYGDRLRLMLGPWWVSKVPREVLEEVGEVAKRYGLKVGIHAAETEREVKEIRRKYGCKGSIDYLREVGLLGPNLVAVHCVHLTPEEIEMLKEYDVKVVHCPTSNAKLGDGIAPLVELLKAGVTVGLGTDGMATNNCVDMFAEMKLACLLQRAIHKDPHVIGANTVLRMATVWAAEVLGDKWIGSLEVGKRADLITLDLSKPHFHPRTDYHLAPRLFSQASGCEDSDRGRPSHYAGSPRSDVGRSRDPQGGPRIPAGIFGPFPTELSVSKRKE